MNMEEQTVNPEVEDSIDIKLWTISGRLSHVLPQFYPGTIQHARELLKQYDPLVIAKCNE